MLDFLVTAEHSTVRADRPFERVFERVAHRLWTRYRRRRDLGVSVSKDAADLVHAEHLPLDSTVFERLQALHPSFPVPATLRGMTRDDYQNAQQAARRLAEVYGVPPIWIEDAYSG